MLWKRTAATLLLAIGAAACTDQPPTGPELTPTEENASRWNPRQVDLAVERAGLLTEIPIIAEQDGEPVEAFLSITELGAAEVDGVIQLTADGIVSYVTEEGQYLAESFQDLPVTLSRAPTAEALTAGLAPPGGSGPLQQLGPSEPGVCDILYLTLGPLELDLLGLTLDLSNIELDLDAVAGAGRLLGNLLCTVTGLLDGLGTLIQILQLLAQINDILDAISNLLSGIPAVGSVLSGDVTEAAAMGTPTARKIENGQFVGTLTVTGITWDEVNETFLVDGILDGKARVDGRIRQVKDVVIEDVPATLDNEDPSMAAAMAPGLMLQRSPNESNICDILYLDLAPTFLDLLGLTIDLDQVELDVDAVPGGGRLLGNLLCAVTGLLDGVGGGGGLGGLLQGLLQGLLDAIGQLLGGLSL